MVLHILATRTLITSSDQQQKRKIQPGKMHTQREETIEHVRTNSAPFISIIWICYAIACHAFIKVFIYVHFCCCCCCWISIRGWMFAQHTHIHTYDIPHFIALLPATTKFGRWIVPVKKCRNNFICLCFWPDCTALKCSHELSLRVYSTAELIFFFCFLSCVSCWASSMYLGLNNYRSQDASKANERMRDTCCTSSN